LVDNDELHLPLTFEFPLSPWYPGYLQREIEKKEYLTPEGGWPVYFLNNHDLPRQALLQLRQESEALRKGSWQPLIHYPYEHLAYLRETESETVLVVINFSYEKNFERDRAIPNQFWQVLSSTHLTSGKIIPLPQLLQPFEVSIFRLEKQQSREDRSTRMDN
jgi:glycosidase